MTLVKRKYRHFDEVFVTGCTKVVKLANFRAARGENFIQMTTFPFPCSRRGPCLSRCSPPGGARGASD